PAARICRSSFSRLSVSSSPRSNCREYAFSASSPPSRTSRIIPLTASSISLPVSVFRAVRRPIASSLNSLYICVVNICIVINYQLPIHLHNNLLDGHDHNTLCAGRFQLIDLTPKVLLRDHGMNGHPVFFCQGNHGRTFYTR